MTTTDVLLELASQPPRAVLGHRCGARPVRRVHHECDVGVAALLPCDHVYHCECTSTARAMACRVPLPPGPCFDEAVRLMVRTVFAIILAVCCLSKWEVLRQRAVRA